MITRDVIERFARARGVTVSQLRGPDRHKVVSLPRREAMWALWRFKEITLVDIGNEFGARDHSTVLWNVRKVQQACDRDPDYEDRLRKIAWGPSLNRAHAIRAVAHDVLRLRRQLKAKEDALSELCAGSDVKAAA